MKRPENNKWLDEALSETIGSEKLGMDFEEWKQRHPKAVEMLTSRTSRINREVLGEIERRQTMFVRKRAWKVAAVLAVLIGVGAIAVVGVNISKIYYYGKTDDGAHIFISDDLETVVTTDEVTDVEQKVRDLEEIALLRQQDKRELLKVEEILRDGTIAWKVHEYKYELSDGRTSDMREGGDGMPVYSQDQFKEFKPKLEEFRQLKKAGQGEDLGTYEQTIKGRVFSFKREKYSLSDGTEFIWSVGTPKKD
ncbi:MAG: hypothetical protein ACETWQ_12400 [Phycisphaerae bacterium]